MQPGSIDAPTQRPRIGFALGSGSARGWSHIGAIDVLTEAGVVPDVICGSSIGSLVGAICADGSLDQLRAWVSDLTWPRVVGFFDLSLSGGLLKGHRLMDFFREKFLDKRIEELRIPFAAVATELETGREVWLRDGPVTAALRASIATPGLFTPCERDGRLLVDGGLVNPVPVSLCRAMGADIVIAIDLSQDLALSARSRARVEHQVPGLVSVVVSCLNIMQVKIARSRLAGEPADVVIAPRLSHLGLLDYHRAREAIAEGRAAAQFALPHIRHLLGRLPDR